MEMGAIWGPNRLLYRAILLSLALHLVIAMFFPALVSFQGDGPSIETISFVRVMHISAQPTHPVAAKHPAVAPERAPVPAVVIPPRKIGTHTSRNTTHLPSRVSRAPLVSSADQRQGGAAAQVAASAPPVAVTATPASASVASSESRDNTGGYMPLGAEENTPVLDPAVRKALDAVGIHTTLTILVDANGKTKSVSFAPDIDANAESQIRSLLAAAHWDPALCGAGIACEGRTTIKL